MNRFLNLIGMRLRNYFFVGYCLFFFYLMISISLNAQKRLSGKYRNSFGDRIQINQDSTFKYTWNFDLQSSWVKGIWRTSGDNVFFTMIPVYDTLTLENENFKQTDSLILSLDDKPERILPQPQRRHRTINEIAKPNFETNNIAALLFSGGQNFRGYYPSKLVVKRQRLYEVVDGKISKKRVKGIWSKRKWPTYYFLSDD
ncbi:MAG: hypothetical protein ACM3H8_08360 [Sphingobacteriales bacterium]